MRKYWDHFDDIDDKFKTLELKVNTPVTKFVFEGHELTLKDENENINKSFKDRGVSYQMAKHIQNGNKKFALSSSGNSALSASYVANFFDVDIELFLSEKINSIKLEELKKFLNSKVKINLSQKPRSDLIKFLNNNPEYINLRGSTDVFALQGFKTISYELKDEIPEIDAIFIPCSSGTSTLGVSQGFKELNINVPIHICQTHKINAIAKYFDNDYENNESSLADAITDRVAHRKKEVINEIKESKGLGWIISDDQLIRDKAIINNLLNKDYSFNSILAFSGWRKAIDKGYNYKNPVLLFSGL